jgi:hypothetical protein
MDDVTARFWSKVDRSGDCWVWQACRNPAGYGRFRLDGRAQLAHRVSYRWAVGVDLGDLCVCHRCDNPPCVNPAHLFVATPAENSADMRAKGRSHRQVGELSGKAKLTEADVATILDLRAGGATLTEIARRFGVHSAHASRICRGLRWPDSRGSGLHG